MARSGASVKMIDDALFRTAPPQGVEKSAFDCTEKSQRAAHFASLSP